MDYKNYSINCAWLILSRKKSIDQFIQHFMSKWSLCITFNYALSTSYAPPNVSFIVACHQKFLPQIRIFSIKSAITSVHYPFWRSALILKQLLTIYFYFLFPESLSFENYLLFRAFYSTTHTCNGNNLHRKFMFAARLTYYLCVLCAPLPNLTTQNNNTTHHQKKKKQKRTHHRSVRKIMLFFQQFFHCPVGVFAPSGRASVETFRFSDSLKRSIVHICSEHNLYHLNLFIIFSNTHFRLLYCNICRIGYVMHRIKHVWVHLMFSVLL